jgi:hypothetical protein
MKYFRRNILQWPEDGVFRIKYAGILDEHRLSQLVPIALGDVALVCGLSLQLLLLEIRGLRFPALQNQLREAGKNRGERSLSIRCHPYIVRFQVRATHGVQRHGLRRLAVRHGGIDQFNNGQFTARNARQLRGRFVDQGAQRNARDFDGRINRYVQRLAAEL